MNLPYANHIVRIQFDDFTTWAMCRSKEKEETFTKDSVKVGGKPKWRSKMQPVIRHG